MKSAARFLHASFALWGDEAPGSLSMPLQHKAIELAQRTRRASVHIHACDVSTQQQQVYS